MSDKSGWLETHGDRIANTFNALVYYSVHGLILAGVPAGDITVTDAGMPDIERTVAIKGVPTIRVTVRIELDEQKVLFDEYFFNSPAKTHLQEFLEKRKSQPRTI